MSQKDCDTCQYKANSLEEREKVAQFISYQVMYQMCDIFRGTNREAYDKCYERLALDHHMDRLREDLENGDLKKDMEKLTCA